jgi:hypothetical protein
MIGFSRAHLACLLRSLRDVMWTNTAHNKILKATCSYYKELLKLFKIALSISHKFNTIFTTQSEISISSLILQWFLLHFFSSKHSFITSTKKETTSNIISSERIEFEIEMKMKRDSVIIQLINSQHIHSIQSICPSKNWMELPSKSPFNHDFTL